MADLALRSVLEAALRRRLLARDRAFTLARMVARVNGIDAIRAALQALNVAEAAMLAELLPNDDPQLTTPYTRYACLGQGRSGTAWLGAGSDGVPVVIKVLHASRLAPGPAVELLIRDLAPLLGQTPHYLVPYRAAFAAADGRAVLVQDYIPGRDLAARAQTKGPMPEARALLSLRQMAKGLNELELMKLPHGMLHPGNVLLDENQRSRFSDWGLAFSRTQHAPRAGFAPAELVLTPWAAPEALGDPVKLQATSDLYSLGCLAYWLLTTEAPFAGSPAQIVVQHRGAPRPDVRNLAGDTSEITAKTVLKCMQVEPSKRYQQALDLVRSLQRNLVQIMPNHEETGLHPPIAPESADSVDLRIAIDDDVPTRQIAPDAAALTPRDTHDEKPPLLLD